MKRDLFLLTLGTAPLAACAGGAKSGVVAPAISQSRMLVGQGQVMNGYSTMGYAGSDGSVVSTAIDAAGSTIATATARYAAGVSMTQVSISYPAVSRSSATFAYVTPSAIQEGRSVLPGGIALDNDVLRGKAVATLFAGEATWTVSASANSDGQTALLSVTNSTGFQFRGDLDLKVFHALAPGRSVTESAAGDVAAVAGAVAGVAAAVGGIAAAFGAAPVAVTAGVVGGVAAAVAGIAAAIDHFSQ